ncbi:MAG: hypothetical protein R2728_05150 [Chitinophagales bacterium]
MYLYHYTLEKYLPGIIKNGIFPNHPYFSKTEFKNAEEAGQQLGVMPHNIDCVLKFRNDGFFQRLENVPSTGRFKGGGDQYQHPARPKPIAMRKINGNQWQVV